MKKETVSSTTEGYSFPRYSKRKNRFLKQQIIQVYLIDPYYEVPMLG